MARTKKTIRTLQIQVVLQRTPVFNVLAGTDAGSPGSLPFVCNGFADVDSSLLREILNKVIASYPQSPISLCVDDSLIVPDSDCADGRGTRPHAAAESVIPVQAETETAPRTARKGRKLDLNSASEEELTRLPGVGPAIARKIVDARPFGSVDDLLGVDGIGAAKLAQIRALVRVG